jgi:epsilon-lactone hydrolase
LILTATRAGELSAAVHTDTELTKAGATTELHVWDGLWHGFFMDPDLPESTDAYNVIVWFFQRHLGYGFSG